jgi:uncharacterized membrane protein (UPF0127 family)
MSSETHENSDEKTASELKPWQLWLGLVGIVLLVSVITAGILFRQTDAAACLQAYSYDKPVRLGSKTFKAQVSDTDAERAKGLGGKTCIGDNQTMLFTFDKADTYCFWMKDMRFPIDIVWLDNNKRVIHVAPKVSPTTYPENFCPDSPSMYVLELKAGMLSQLELTEGDQARF